MKINALSRSRPCVCVCVCVTHEVMNIMTPQLPTKEQKHLEGIDNTYVACVKLETNLPEMSSWFRRSLFYGAAALCTYKVVKFICESSELWAKKNDFESLESSVSTGKQNEPRRREKNSSRPLPFLKDIERLAFCNDKANQPNNQTNLANLSGTKKSCCQRNTITSSNPQVAFKDNKDAVLADIRKSGDLRYERSRDIARAKVLKPVSTAKIDTRKVPPSKNIAPRLPFLKDIKNLVVCSNVSTQLNKKLNLGHVVDAEKSQTSLDKDRAVLLADIQKRRVLREGKQDIARARALKWLQTPRTPKQGKVVSIMEELQTKTSRKAKTSRKVKSISKRSKVVASSQTIYNDGETKLGCAMAQKRA